MNPLISPLFVVNNPRHKCWANDSINYFWETMALGESQGGIDRYNTSYRIKTHNSKNSERKSIHIKIETESSLSISILEIIPVIDQTHGKQNCDQSQVSKTGSEVFILPFFS